MTFVLKISTFSNVINIYAKPIVQHIILEEKLWKIAEKFKSYCVFDEMYLFYKFIEVNVVYIAMLRTAEDTTLVWQDSHSSVRDTLVLEP